MNYIQRIRNAYKSGGINEIARKAFFHYLYRANNYITRKKVLKANLENGLNISEVRQRKVIVSLTSYPKRFDSIHLSLKSLLLQSVKPDKIIVYFGCDTNESDLTDKMLELQKYGIEYRFDKEKNLMAHKKYYYAMQEYPNDIIVTADDDLYYPLDWLESLLNSYKKYPNAISARRVHRIKFDGDSVKSYNSWEDQCRNKRCPAYDLLATGGSGKLYPPSCLVDDTFDVDKITKLCLKADDIWLKCMEILSGTPIVWVHNNEVDQLSVDGSVGDGLADSNVDMCMNDVLLSNVMEFYGICANDFRYGIRYVDGQNETRG